ncbi:MAG: hypothetical protein EXR76_00935 [Myxococcales bacterium]|nr:hypothetical protein [Myxococcales bacterium]
MTGVNDLRFNALKSLLVLVLLASPAKADPWAHRSYPDGAGQVAFAPSKTYLLVEPTPGLMPGMLQTAVTSAHKTARLVRTRTYFDHRWALQLDGLKSHDELRQLGDALIESGHLRRVWPALTRSTGVAFTDENLAFRAVRPLSPEQITKAGLTDVRETVLPSVYRARALNADAIGAAHLVKQLDEVSWAEPDLIRDVAPYGLPDDPRLADQWHLDNDEDRGDIDAGGAWQLTTGVRDVVVGIFDTGFDLDHPDLLDNFVGGFDAAGGDGIPEAGCSVSPDGAGPSAQCPQQAPFRESHGTAVAGVAAAKGGNGRLGTGVCPDCAIFPVRLLGDGGAFRSLSNAEAFRRAADEGVDIINNSWGPSLTRFFPLAQSEREAMAFVTREANEGRGIAVFFAAGNDFFTPATANPYASYFDNMAVAASTRKDDFACYSDYGDVIAFAAPSQGCFDNEPGIATSDYVGAEGYSGDDFTTAFGGTSAASPVAAGLAGLILSANQNLTAQQVKLILQVTAEKIRADQNDWQRLLGVDLEVEFEYDERGFSKGFGYGRINAAAAVAMAIDAPPLTGAVCDAMCPQCFDGRCAPVCAADIDCPGASKCRDLDLEVLTLPGRIGMEPPVGMGRLGCVIPRPGPTAVGQPCSNDCERCVRTVDSEFETVDICTANCENDESCPFGFDCRSVESDMPTVCVPGNAECGAEWGSVRCQSEVRVSAGGNDFCSCECVPGDSSSCPDGFDCSWVTCDQTRDGIVCVSSSQRESNYYPVCLPDPDFEAPCERHVDCGGGLFCIDGNCAVDSGAGGCDACTACDNDADCERAEDCVDTGTRGKRCLTPCQLGDECPGNTACTNVPGPPDTYCLNDNVSTKGMCPRGWRCEMPGRCFGEADCDDGVACVDNVCQDVVIEAPDAAAPDAAIPDATVLPADADTATDDAALSETDAAEPDADEGGNERPATSDGCQLAPGTAPTSFLLALLTLSVLAAARGRRRRGLKWSQTP